MAQSQPPGFMEVDAEPFRPFHCHQGVHGPGFLFFLQKKVISGSGVLQPVEIQVDKHCLPLFVGIVLSQGEGWACDRLADP